MFFLSMYPAYPDPIRVGYVRGPHCGKSLEALAHKIIDDDAHYSYPGNAGLSSNFWPEVYWESPDSFTFDDDETPPERREVTEEIVIGMADWVWTPQYSWILGQAGHATFNQLVDFCAEKFDLTTKGAANLLYKYKRQIESNDGKRIDDEKISDDDVEFLIGSIKACMEQALVSDFYIKLGNAAYEYKVAGEDEEERCQRRDEAIFACADEGLPVSEIAYHAELPRTTIEKMLSKRQA